MSYENDLLRRALRAYFRGEPLRDIPSGSSGVELLNGREYVHLHNGGGTLAIYRVTTSGKLKALKRWPAKMAWSRW